MSASLEDMAERAAELADRFTARRTFEEARAALNEAGMLRARGRLEEALQRIGKAQAEVRFHADVVARLKATVESHTLEAEWDLDARFVVDGNKTYLVDGDERRAMTVDERAKWKAREAAKNDVVREAARLAREGDLELAAAKDELVLSEKQFQAARADLDAAIATVGILAASIKGETK